MVQDLTEHYYPYGEEGECKMGRGCQWPFAVGRGAPSYTDIGEGARAANDAFRDPTINQLIGEKEKKSKKESDNGHEPESQM